MIIGGIKESSASDEIYSLEGNSWIRRGTLGTKRRLHACTALGKYLYIVGGTSANAKLATTEILDMETWEVQSGPDLPWQASSCQAVSHNGTVYVVGGHGKVVKLDKSTNTWTNIPHIKVSPKLRQVFPPQLVGNKIVDF